MRKAILITGAAGYIGHLVLNELVRNYQNIVTIVAYDIKPVPKEKQLNGVLYIQGDIRDNNLGKILKEQGVDTVVHLASIVTPGKKRNREFEYSVDVFGTENLLRACMQNHVKKFIITSSGAAYGYYPDNPQWLKESDVIRGNEEFAYAYHKRLIEEILAKYRREYPAMQQLILRPGTVLGESTSNQITDLFKKRFVLGVRGAEIPFVFIWDEDVVNVILEGIHKENEGIYNLSGDGYVTMGEIAKILGKPYLRMPPSLLKTGLFILQKLGLSQYGPDQIDFLRYRPILSNEKLKEEFRYQPKYTSAEVFDLYIKTNYQQKRLS